MRALALIGLVAALATSLAAGEAVVVEDFEGGDWAGAGAVQANPAGAGSALYLDTGEYVEIPLPTGGAGELTIDVYDMGWEAADHSDDIQGPRWGVAGTAPTSNAVTAAMMHKPWLSGDGGYCWSGEEPGCDDGIDPDNPDGGNGPSSAYNWFGPFWLSMSRQKQAWATWTFTVDADGLVTVTASFSGKSVATTVGLTDAAQFAVAFGGSDSSRLYRRHYNGFYIDNIVWTPAAAPQTPGDADGDGDVDLDDFAILKLTFGDDPLTDDRADFDGDGDVDLDDFAILKTNFGS